MTNFSLKYIYNLYKSAATDIPNYFKDTWVESHPEIQNRERLSDIKKEIPIQDYRERIEFDFAKFSEILTNEEKIKFTKAFGNISRYVCMGSVTQIRKKIGELNNKLIIIENDMALESVENLGNKIKYKLIKSNINNLILFEKAINDFWDSIDPVPMMQALSEGIEELKKILITSKDIRFSIGKNDIFYQKGCFIPRVAEKICSLYLEIIGEPLISGKDFNLSTLRDTTQYKDLAYLVSEKYKQELEKKSKDQFEIVFSTQAVDLLSMSTRSNWTSCQNLLKPKTDLNPLAIYSAISPYVGIIYLTNKTPYRGREEEMVARALVFYVENENNQEPALTISRTYSSLTSQDFFTHIFFRSLKEKSPIPIIDYSEAISNYYFPTENENPANNPYFDTLQNYPTMRLKLRNNS